MVNQTCASWNPLRSWLGQLDSLRRANSMVDESMSFRTFEQDKIAEGLLSAENE
jgi:hypothetical protein